MLRAIIFSGIGLLLIYNPIMEQALAQAQSKPCYYLKAKVTCDWSYEGQRAKLDEEIWEHEFDTDMECLRFVRQYLEYPPGSWAAENCKVEPIYTCESCDKIPGKKKKKPKSSHEDDENLSSSKKLNSEPGDKYFEQIVGKEIIDWYLDTINPLQLSNLLRVGATLVAEGALKELLSKLGAARSAQEFSQTYIGLATRLNQAALRELHKALGIAAEDQRKFLISAATHMRSASQKSFTPIEVSDMQKAFLMAANYGNLQSTGNAAFLSSVLVGAAGILAAEAGEKEAATVLLNSAIALLSKSADNSQRSKLNDMLRATTTTFDINLNSPSVGSQSTPIARESNVPNIAGEYECVEGPACQPVGTRTSTVGQSTITTTISPVTIIQTGSTVILKSIFTMIHNSSFGSIESTTESECRGEIVGKHIEFECTSTTRSSSGVPQQALSNRGTIQILPDGRLRASSTGPDGRTYTSILQRR